MNLYMVNLNNKTDIYSNIGDIPHEMSEEQVDQLHKTSLVQFLSKDGEITILLSKDNKKIYPEVDENQKPSDKRFHHKTGHSVISYNEAGSASHEEYYMNGEYHRENGPAIIGYYNENGSIQSEKYYMNGKLHREDGPAVISYHINGHITYDKYFINGKYHREDGPSIICYHEDGSIKYEKYYIHGLEQNQNN
jgi:antitoxin component YwqK of YwqJK toxin-antitoxin module